jgi:TM2 domain-containing membrane protein YozV
LNEATKRSASFGSDGKNIVVAYLLWWFLGVLGIHRFYLGKPKTGLAQLLLLAFGWLPLFLGWIVLGIWWLLDAYFVFKYVSDHNQQTGGEPLSFTVKTNQSVKGDLDHLERLHDLREKGVLTEEEYQTRRNNALN